MNIFALKKQPVEQTPSFVARSQQAAISPEAETLRAQLVEVSRTSGNGMRGVAEYVLQREAVARETAKTREAELLAMIAELNEVVRLAHDRLSGKIAA
jgi:hypothetical protein